MVTIGVGGRHPRPHYIPGNITGNNKEKLRRPHWRDHERRVQNSLYLLPSFL